MKKLLLLLLLIPVSTEAQVSRVWIRQGTTLPVSCTNKTVLFNLTATDGANAAGIYRCTGTAYVVVTTVTSAIGATSTDGMVLQNTTAATVGAQKWSPRLRLTGRGWKTDATAGSQTVDWIIENQPVQGAANPSTNLVFSSQVNAGGYTPRMTISSAGALTITSCTGCGGITNGAPANNIPVSNGTNLITGSLFDNGGGVISTSPGVGLTLSPTVAATANQGASIALTASDGFAEVTDGAQIGGDIIIQSGNAATGDGVDPAEGGAVNIQTGSGVNGGASGAIILTSGSVIAATGLFSVDTGGTAQIAATASNDTINIGDPAGGGNLFGLRVVGGATQSLVLGDTGGANLSLDVTTSTATLSATLALTPVAFASLPASPVEGMIAWVTDSNTATFRATIAGGGANKVLAIYDGTNWTVH